MENIYIYKMCIYRFQKTVCLQVEIRLVCIIFRAALIPSHFEYSFVCLLRSL